MAIIEFLFLLILSPPPPPSNSPQSEVVDDIDISHSMHIHIKSFSFKSALIRGIDIKISLGFCKLEDFKVGQIR